MVFCDDWQRRLSNSQVVVRKVWCKADRASGAHLASSGLLQTTRPVDLQIRRISSKPSVIVYR